MDINNFYLLFSHSFQLMTSISSKIVQTTHKNQLIRSRLQLQLKFLRHKVGIHVFNTIVNSLSETTQKLKKQYTYPNIVFFFYLNLRYLVS